MRAFKNHTKRTKQLAELGFRGFIKHSQVQWVPWRDLSEWDKASFCDFVVAVFEDEGVEQLLGEEDIDLPHHRIAPHIRESIREQQEEIRSEATKRDGAHTKP